MTISRRRFVQGLTAVGIGATVFQPSRAGLKDVPPTATGTSKMLSGRHFELVIEETLVNFTGKPRIATTINGSIPGPTLRWKEGEVVTIKVKNRL